MCVVVTCLSRVTRYYPRYRVYHLGGLVSSEASERRGPLVAVGRAPGAAVGGRGKFQEISESSVGVLENCT